MAVNDTVARRLTQGMYSPKYRLQTPADFPVAQSLEALHSLIKDLATASLPEYVATHSHQTDYLRP